MVDNADPRASDAAPWLLMASMAVGCILAIRGEGFAVDLPGALLPGLGLLVLIAAVCIGRTRQRPRLAAGATAFLHMTLFTVLAVTMAYALAARGGPLWDARLAAADARLGLHWPAILRVADTLPAMLWLGGIAYQSLVAQMIVCIVALSASGRTAALQAAVVAAILSGAATIAISGVVPAMGNLFDPALYHHLPSSVAWQERGLITGLRDGSGRVLDYGRLMGIVSFPSYHATLPVILAWSLRDVRFFGIAAPAWAGITVAATPIFGGHYGVDVLGGLGLPLLAIPLASRITRRNPPPTTTVPTIRSTVQPVLVRDDRKRAKALQACRLAAKGIG